MSLDSDDECPTFTNSQQEINYWKNKAADYKRRMKESVQELEEYQSHSSELEAELEAELEQSTARCSELRHQVAKLASENENLKDRLASQSNALEGRVDSLEEELQDVRSIKEGLTAYIRQLEQANDDLERAKRATLTSLEDFESRLNQAIERNAFLESELDEKESLKETVQRLKDESRDLRQEVSVRQAPTLPPMPECNPTLTNQITDNDIAAKVCENKTAEYIIDSNKLADEQQKEFGNVKNGSAHSIGSSPSVPPSARLSALSIVGDLLRKVGALESRLASCRTLVKDNNHGASVTMGTNAPPNNSSAR